MAAPTVLNRALARSGSIALFSLLFLGLSGSAFAQLSCTASTSPRTIRAEGESEPVSDVVLHCTGGTPTDPMFPIPIETVTLTLSAPVTTRLAQVPLYIGTASRTLGVASLSSPRATQGPPPGTGPSEALLLADEPDPSIQYICSDYGYICQSYGTGGDPPIYTIGDGLPDVFQMVQISATELALPFELDPPGPSGQLTLRFTNLRVNALAVSPGTPISATVSFSGPLTVNVSNPTVSVGTTRTGVALTTQNVQINNGAVSQFTVSFAEQSGAVFRTRTSAMFVDNNTSPAPVAQDIPGSLLLGTETGFYNPNFSQQNFGLLGTAGLADNGTRLLVRLLNVPSATQVYVPLTVNLMQGSTVTGVARLVSADPSGAGQFSPASSTTLVNNSGTVTAVYEVLNANATDFETANIPFTLTGTGLASLSGQAGLAPLSNVASADLTAPEPRFNSLTSFTVAVPAPPTSGIPPTIITSSLPDAPVGTPYQTSVYGSNGTPPYVSWSATGLPPGLAISQVSNTGVISGTPTTAGTYNVTLSVRDSAGLTGTTTLTLLVYSGVHILTTQLPYGSVGVDYSQAIQVEGGTPPYTYSVTTVGLFQSGGMLPPGLMLDSSGALKGIPTATGMYAFGINVTDSNGNQGNQSYTVNISPALLFTTLSPLPDGVAGTAYTATIAAKGGTPPYNFFATTSLPLGLTLSPNGTLSGKPLVQGTFTFTVQLTDSKGVVVKMPYTVTFAAAPPALQISQLKLLFSAAEGGDRPDAQTVVVLSSAPSQSQYVVKIDGGTDGSAAPPWLSSTPLVGATPARLTIAADQGSMPAGSYSGRLIVSVKGDQTQPPAEIDVMLTVKASPPSLAVDGQVPTADQPVPTLLRFGARIESPGQQTQSFLVSNSGGSGNLPFTVSVQGSSPWLNVSTEATSTGLNSPVRVNVTADSTGLDVGQYRDVILVHWLGGDVPVPVVLFVSDQGPILNLSATGATFTIREGNGTPSSSTVQIFNTGDPATTIQWSADILGSSTWLTLSPSSGTAGATTPGTLTLTPAASVSNLPAGAYYALVRVSDPNALDSPQYLTAVLDVRPADDPPELDLSPAGVVLTSSAGQTLPLTQTISVKTSSNTPVSFAAAASAVNNGTWLSVSPTTGMTSTSNPGTVTASIDPSKLTAGVYTGEVDLAIGASLRAFSVTLIVTGGSPASASLQESARRLKAVAPPGSAAGCVPSRVAVTETGLANNFSVPSGWPASLTAQVNDDCGTAVTNGSVVASFSNGDPPLTLHRTGATSGAYSATWQPGTVMPGMTVSIRAAAGALGVATADLNGNVAANSVATLTPNGTVSNLNPQLGGPLSPGIVSAIYGSGLSAVSESTGQVPLATSYKGTTVLIGGYQAPLYFVSPNQLNAQIPSELQPNRQYAIVASANGALTLPQNIDVVSQTPGVAAYSDGTLIAQHTNFDLVDAQHPAVRGEYLIMYLVGLGATDPSVASGTPSPSDPLATPVVKPTVTVDGETADIAFAGLTPGGVGLFQIDFKVPNDAKLGTPLNVVVMQGSVTANVTTLTVSQ
jgi:uncharacterized protein (TIGR03437 family)